MEERLYMYKFIYRHQLPYATEMLIQRTTELSDIIEMVGSGDGVMCLTSPGHPTDNWLTFRQDCCPYSR